MTYNKPEVLMLGHAAEVIQGHPKATSNVDANPPLDSRKLYIVNPAVDLDE